MKILSRDRCIFDTRHQDCALKTVTGLWLVDASLPCVLCYYTLPAVMSYRTAPLSYLELEVPFATLVLQGCLLTTPTGSHIEQVRALVNTLPVVPASDWSIRCLLLSLLSPRPASLASTPRTQDNGLAHGRSIRCYPAGDWPHRVHPLWSALCRRQEGAPH